MIHNVDPQLSQWDVGRSVSVTDSTATHIHFANQGDSKAAVIEIINGKAKIPNYLLQTGKQVVAYSVFNGVTLESKTFAVRKREKPEHYVYEDDHRNYIYELIGKAENAVSFAAQTLNEKQKFQAQENIGVSTCYNTKREEIGKKHEKINAEYIWGLYDALKDEYPDNVQKNEVRNNDGTFVNYEYVISTKDTYSDDGGYELDRGDDGIKKPKYLIMSAIDGNERLNVFSTYRFVRDILRGHNVPQFFKEGVILHVLPVGSPWGFTNRDRFNENNVHIYYNFDCEWKSRSGTNPVYGDWTSGSAPASEKETQAITQWLNNNADADLFISYHNTGGINEIAIILGDSNNYETDVAKKIAMRGVSKVIPFWKNVIRYPAEMYTPYASPNGEYAKGNRDVIFSYSANHRVGGTSVLYAQEKLGIPSFILETPVYYGDYRVYEEAGMAIYHPESIAAGAETLGNILIEYYDQSVISEVSDGMNSKLDQILQRVSFRIEKGNFTPSENVTAVTIADIPANAKTVEIRAVSELSAPVISGSDKTKWVVPVAYISYSSAPNNHKLPTGRNMFVEYFIANGWYNEPSTATFGDDGMSFTLLNGEVLEGSKTYEWTAYYWDE